MQRLIAVNPAEATGKAKQLLDGVQAKLGITPNLMKTLATAPAALEGYLNFGAALATYPFGEPLLAEVLGPDEMAPWHEREGMDLARRKRRDCWKGTSAAS